MAGVDLAAENVMEVYSDCFSIMFLQDAPLWQKEWPDHFLWQTAWIKKWTAEGSWQCWCNIQLTVVQEIENMIIAENDPTSQLSSKQPHVTADYTVAL
jgi:hypothetical protein